MTAIRTRRIAHFFAFIAIAAACSILSAWVPVALSLPRPNNRPARTVFFGAASGTHQFMVELYRYHWGIEIADISVFGFERTGLAPNTVHDSKTETLYYLNRSRALPLWCVARNEPSQQIGEDYRAYQVASGWPITAWTGRYVGTNEVVFGVHTDARTEGALPAGLVNHYASPVVLLPLTPVFPGALLSITMYSVLAWFVVAVPVREARSWRRRTRLSKGLCPTCKHELAGVSPCPECGSSIANRAEPTANESDR